MTQGWLIVERFENWEVDAANGFSFFGLTDRYRKLAASIAEGDLVFSYVSSGRSAFADIRRVQASGLRKLRTQSYDSAFDNYFSTVPVLVLPQKDWLPLKRVADSLELTKGRTDYRPLFQTSLRKLSGADASVLQRAMEAAFQAPIEA